MNDADEAILGLTPGQAFDQARKVKRLRALKNRATREEKPLAEQLRKWLHHPDTDDEITLDDGEIVRIQSTAGGTVYALDRLSDADIVVLARMPGLLKVDGQALGRLSKNSDHPALHHLRETGAPGQGSSKLVYEAS